MYTYINLRSSIVSLKRLLIFHMVLVKKLLLPGQISTIVLESLHAKLSLREAKIHSIII